MAKKRKGARYWKKRIDLVFHRYIRLRDTDKNWWGTCITCDKKLHFKDLQAGHFVPRQHMNTRWDPRNVNTQCARCNQWEGGAQYEYSKKLGQELSDELFRLSRQVTKFSEIEYEEIYYHYKTLMEETEDNKMLY